MSSSLRQQHQRAAVGACRSVACSKSLQQQFSALQLEAGRMQQRVGFSAHSRLYDIKSLK
jgi:hypothetical protein